MAVCVCAGVLSLVYYDRWMSSGAPSPKASPSTNPPPAANSRLATMLVVGFGVHNVTEGFGIVAPLATGDDRPSWGVLALLGLIGGGPTFVGTTIGQSCVNDTVSIAFLELAAGSILYVVIELLSVGRKLGYKLTLT